MNSKLAVLACQTPDNFVESISLIQNELFNVGAWLSMGQQMFKPDKVDWLEQSLDELNQLLTPLKEFILPGGGLAASHCHVARAICRRAERSLVGLNKQDALNRYLLAVR